MSHKQITHERDRYRCLNCRATEEVVREFHMDHITPRGWGGSERLPNKATLCDRCHRAKHGECIAPTVRLMSTGTMTDTEFAWFKHLMRVMLPALARQANVKMRPKFDLAGEDEWAIPLGDIRALDDELAERDDNYASLKTHEFM